MRDEIGETRLINTFLHLPYRTVHQKIQLISMQYENGTFYGMVDIIHRGDMDLLAGSLTLKPSRAAGVSYLHPIGIETYGLILPAVER